MNGTAKKFAFILGREQEICLEELKAVLNHFCFSFSIYRISGNVVFAKVDNLDQREAEMLTSILGGTIKIFELKDSIKGNIADQLATLIFQMKEKTSGKINFGVSNFNKNISRQKLNSFALSAKNKLRGKMSLRYVESKDGGELSSILTLKNNLLKKGLEIGIFEQEVGVLLALNNPEDWSNRDYGKPRGDKFSGMLPPKLARMMINIARSASGIQKSASSIQNTAYSKMKETEKLNIKFSMQNAEQSTIVLDPFCGSGNILLEAMLSGCHVIGSDVSPKAVSDSKANIDWLLNQHIAYSSQYSVFEADATAPEYIEMLNTEFPMLNVSDKSIVFVTEPYLGRPKKYIPELSEAVSEYEKIKELYLKFLNNIKQLAVGQEQLAICIVFPLVETAGQNNYSLFNECVDEIKKMGYTQIRPTLIYGREYQVVKREIVLLELESQKSTIKN